MVDTKQKPSESGNSKFRQESEAVKPSEKLRHKGEQHHSGNSHNGDDSDKSRTSGQVDPKSKPKTKVEKAALRVDRQIEKSKLRADKSGKKLDNVREKLAAQKPYKPPGVVKRLSHAASAEISMQVHRKIRDVERENVGVEAAHNAELHAERVGRMATRHVKHRIRSRPARRVHKTEKLNIKHNADLRFRQMAKENPTLKSNALKRFYHKKRIQKQFRKQASKAAKKATTQAAVKTKVIVAKVIKPVLLLAKNPKVLLIVGICLLIVLIVQSCVAMSTSLFSGIGGGIVASTYLSEDADMLAAEAAYSAIESGLQHRLDNYEALNPGFDEYRYDLDEIGHDPYVLISILSALHDGPWAIGEVQGVLAMLFDLQYTLTETVMVEVRYRTEERTGTSSWTDADGNTHTESYTYTVIVPYDYYIITVTLRNFNLSHLPVYIMNEEQLSRYALYMATLGNRPDLFPVSLFPRASYRRGYERYDIPPEALSDPVFAAMIAEAEKHLGRPYVWGGSNPSTSFDCSGYVSWVINNTFWNVGRLGAKGLYNICTPVSPANARPGDLVFFWRTYRAPDPNAATHVGIYVGNGMMIHCGNPISYTSINTTYWQNHFFGFARLPPP